MAPSFVSVSDIAGNCGDLSVMVRVVRLWTIPSFNNASVAGSIEMILMDKNGDKIHCSVRKYLVSRFLSVLVEGQCYRICCLALVPNLGSYRTTRHDSKLVFHFKTTVNPVELPEVDLYGISPTPFSDILNDTLDADYLIDVIGLMTGLSQPKEYEREGKVSKMSVLELTSDNLKVECALFGEYVDQIQSYVHNGEIELPVVVLQSVKVKSFRGKAGLQNVMFASKILFNPDIEAVVHFKNSISIQGSIHDPSFNIYKEPLHVSVEDDFMKCTPHSTIERLTANKESGSFIILGTINSVIEDGPWWYCACRCGRSVMQEGGMYFCDVCNTHKLSVCPRFKLKLEVEDSTGVGVFILFERECSSIFRKTCAEFFMEHMKNPEAVRANVYPSVFHELNGRKMLFKIETKVVSPTRYHGTFRVRRICDDSSILSMFALSGSDLTPTKAIFAPTFSPMMSLGDLESVGVGGNSTISLGDDTDNLSGGKNDVMAAGTDVINVQPFIAKKHVSRVSAVCLPVYNKSPDGKVVDVMTPAKRKLEEDFEAVASPFIDDKSEGKKVAMI